MEVQVTVVMQSTRHVFVNVGSGATEQEIITAAVVRAAELYGQRDTMTATMIEKEDGTTVYLLPLYRPA